MGQNSGRFDGTDSKDEADKIARRPSTFASDVMTRLAARGVLCQNNLADPKCLGYDGHLDAFCKGADLAESRCSEYTGHEKAKLDAFCIEKPLRKYPEVAMTANDNSRTSGYSVVQSTLSTRSAPDTRKAWSLFNHVTSGSVGDTYHGDDGVTTNSIFSPYNNADGTYRENPLESLGGVNGTWLYIRLPKKISLDHVNLISRSGHPQRVPRSATFLGSNNGTDWTSIFSFSDAGLIGDSSSGEHTYTYNVNSTVKYEYFGFVWEKIGTEYYVNLEELELYGHEEDNLADSQCSGYDGHLNAFCETNLADPKCEGQPGYLDAFCTGENLADPKCEEQPEYALRYLNQTATYTPAGTKPYWRITNSSGDHIGSPIFVTNVAGTATMEATAFWRKYPGYNATFDVREVPDPNTDTIWQATCEVDRAVGFCV
jgi:hypothetical protein